MTIRPHGVDVRRRAGWLPEGCSPVLVDQPVDDLAAPDPGRQIDRLAGLVQRKSLFPRPAGPAVVVVLRVLAEDLAKVSFTIDQEVAGALAP